MTAVTGFSCNGCWLLRPEYFLFLHVRAAVNFVMATASAETPLFVLCPTSPSLLFSIYPPSVVSLWISQAFFMFNRDLLLNYSSSTFCNLKRSFHCAMMLTCPGQSIYLISIHDSWHNYCLKNYNTVYQSLSHILKTCWVKRQSHFYFSEKIPYCFS